MTMKTRLQSVSLIFACGTALFSDGYANGVIGSVITLLTRVYGQDALARHNYNRTLSSLGFAGTVLGMLVFGWLSDKIGRKFGMMSATCIVAIFSVLTAVSSGAHGSVGGMLTMLSACRFLLGIGVGAEFPCGSVAAAEQSEEEGISKKAQHRWVALSTGCAIDFGFVISSFVPLVLYWIFGPNHLRAVWRLSLGLGAVPAVAVFIWRYKMDEPLRYKKDSMKQARIPYMLVFRRYGVSLAAISCTWFLYNFILYPFGIYSSTIVNNITGGSQALSVVFGWNVVINLFYMPGCIGGAFLLDHLNPKWIMITGLLLQALTGFLMSGLYVQLTDHVAAFAVMYGIFLSFGELGPGNCTILFSSKTSCTAIRGQFYGVAAAAGKIGAFVGIWAFPPMIDAFGGPNSLRGNTGPFWVGSGLAILSAIVTYFFIQPMSHDGLVKEDLLFREYLQSHGYDTSQMGFTGSTADSEESWSLEEIGVVNDKSLEHVE